MRISDWSSDVCSSDLADAGGPVKLVARENIIVAAQCRDIDRQPRHRLATIDQQFGADAVREVRRACNVERTAKHVRDMRKGDHIMFGGEQLFSGIEVDAAVFGQWADVDLDRKSVV